VVYFNSLRLSGFKSFVDPTDVLVEPGVTAIVGPNGCGKSNLVEALRWVMGENSAKRMRGGEMDDVIFSGSANRPARNVADVLVSLDNSDRNAPAHFNDSEILEVSRRIVRGQGSVYRINGKEVRARDVQILFADLATGSHSTAMVSQGRVGALINAKAIQRRALLEEAAGITGLHSRRHEAELRLRAAESNLERLDDVITTLEAQHQGLKKQARQATRYRNLNNHLRRLEAILLHLDVCGAKTALAQAEETMAAAEVQVAETTREAAAQTRLQAEAAERLPALRQAEAEAAAALQRLRLDRDGLDREAERAADQHAQASERLRQIENDGERVQRLLDDAAQAEDRLAEERTRLAGADDAEEEARADAKTALEAAEGEVAVGESSLGRLAEKVAADEARAATLERQTASLTARIERLRGELDETIAERTRLEGQRISQAEIDAAKTAVDQAEQRLETLRAEAQAAADNLGGARGVEEVARENLREKTETTAKMEAEVEALAALLEAGEPDMWPAMVDALSVAEGLETALGAALGDDLTASSDEAAPMHWHTLAPYERRSDLPEGAEPLSRRVKGPPALARRLGQIGVVPDAATGRRLQDLLRPGQRLVTREGALWRWDGFTIEADAPTAAAQRLAQRNRLAQLRGALEGARTARETARRAFEEVRTAAQNAQTADGAAREALNTFFAELDVARRLHGELAQNLAAVDNRVAGLGDAEKRLAGDLDEAEQGLRSARTEAEDLPDLAAARVEVERLRAELQGQREQLKVCHERLHTLLREAESRAQRILAIDSERASWNQRATDARQHTGELDARGKTVRDELSILEALPREIEAKRLALTELLDEAETRRKAAADALAEGETRQAELARTLKEAEALTQAAREDRVRGEGALEHAREGLQALIARVGETLECGPDEILARADIGPDEELPAREDAEFKLARLERERENMGPVNLRAEAEAEELDLRITGMQTERSDLVSAIARLRQGIATLNREGRQRLLAAFEAVNSHFSELFVRLFGGGRAHLSLTEADDPLEAGLEIMASPPGKRLQVMSLLSGGEQALTALALLFAVFLTNPAPVCVLDEVDAPLDDANVDRLCSLLDELVASSSTRFLMITHHRMTMARANRLYGVTMSERGVSQLVSVDLETASSLRETA
jgi:chromosome segregation protein